MHNADKSKFAEVLAGCAACYNREVTGNMAAVFMDALEDYTLDEVKRAFRYHIKHSTFFPTPADIIRLIPKSKTKQHPGPDEAWAIAIKLRNDDDTVIVTPQILAAWSVACEVMQFGDDIGARMAFKDAYNATDRTDASQWQVSAGNDKALRYERVKQAVADGYLPGETVSHYLTHDSSDMTPESLIALAEQRQLRLAAKDGQVVKVDKSELKAKWASIRQNINSGKAKVDDNPGHEKMKQYREAEEHRRDVLLKQAGG